MITSPTSAMMRFCITLELDPTLSLVVPIKGRPEEKTISDLLSEFRIRLIKKLPAYATYTAVHLTIDSTQDVLDPIANQDDTLDLYFCDFSTTPTITVRLEAIPQEPQSSQPSVDEAATSFPRLRFTRRLPSSSGGGGGGGSGVPHQIAPRPPQPRTQNVTTNIHPRSNLPSHHQTNALCKLPDIDISPSKVTTPKSSSIPPPTTTNIPCMFNTPSPHHIGNQRYDKQASEEDTDGEVESSSLASLNSPLPQSDTTVVEGTSPTNPNTDCVVVPVQGNAVVPLPPPPVARVPSPPTSKPAMYPTRRVGSSLRHLLEEQQSLEREQEMFDNRRAQNQRVFELEYNSRSQLQVSWKKELGDIEDSFILIYQNIVTKEQQQALMVHLAQPELLTQRKNFEQACAGENESIVHEQQCLWMLFENYAKGLHQTYHRSCALTTSESTTRAELLQEQEAEFVLLRTQSVSRLYSITLEQRGDMCASEECGRDCLEREWCRDYERLFVPQYNKIQLYLLLWQRVECEETTSRNSTIEAHEHSLHNFWNEFYDGKTRIQLNLDDKMEKEMKLIIEEETKERSEVLDTFERKVKMYYRSFLDGLARLSNK